MNGSTTEQWFYADGAGVARGPVSADQLTTAVAARVLSETTTIWREGMPSWLAYRDCFPQMSCGNASSKSAFETPITRPIGIQLAFGLFLVPSLLALTWYLCINVGLLKTGYPFVVSAIVSLLSASALAISISGSALRQPIRIGLRGVALVLLMTWMLALLPLSALIKRAYFISTFAETLHYDVSRSADLRTIRVSGDIGFGLHAAVREQLVEGLTTTIEFDSPGGLAKQAEHLAQLIRIHKLHTQVLSNCSSACLVAFFSGNKRIANYNATFGFHSPSFPEGMPGVSRKLSAQLVQDYIDEMADLNIPAELLDAIRETPADDIYLVAPILLYQSGHVTDLIGEPEDDSIILN